MVKSVRKLEDILEQQGKMNQNTNRERKDSSQKKHPKKQTQDQPRGKPKSGKMWKSSKTKFSSVVKTKGIRDSFEKKQTLRKELKRVKEASRAIVAAKQEEKELQKQRRRENLQRQEENRKKSEIVQVIRNPNKLKRMKKKQLRYIEKRDTNEVK